MAERIQPTPTGEGSGRTGCIHVGEFVRDEMEARGWDANEMARRMCERPEDFAVHRLCLDIMFEVRDPLVRLGETADALARAFGTSATLWTRLDEAWRAAQVPSPTAARGDWNVIKRIPEVREANDAIRALASKISASAAMDVRLKVEAAFMALAAAREERTAARGVTGLPREEVLCASCLHPHVAGDDGADLGCGICGCRHFAIADGKALRKLRDERDRLGRMLYDNETTWVAEIRAAKAEIARLRAAAEQGERDREDAERWRWFMEQGAWLAVNEDGVVCFGAALDSQDDMRERFPEAMGKLDNGFITDAAEIIAFVDVARPPHQGRA